MKSQNSFELAEFYLHRGINLNKRRFFRQSRTLLLKARKLCKHPGLLAQVYCEIGKNLFEDPHGCERLARRCFIQAVQLDSSYLKNRLLLGQAFIRLGKLNSGLKVLNQALMEVITEPELLEIVVRALREAQRLDLAYEALVRARLQRPGCYQIRQLLDRVRYDLACREQLQKAETPSKKNKVTASTPPNTGDNRATKILNFRRDAAEQPSRPHILKFETKRR